MTNKQVIVGDEQAISPEGSGIPLVQGTTEDPDERSGHPATENAAVTFLNEILDYFQNENRDPGGDWAFPDDFSSLCLDYRDRHETKFWLDIERDGTIRVFWKPRGGPMKAMDFVGETSAVSGDRTGADANSAGSVNQAISPEAESSRPLPSASDDLGKACPDCGAPIRDHMIGGPAPYHPQPVKISDDLVERLRSDPRSAARMEAADTITSLRAQLAAAEAETKRWHKVAMDAGAVTCVGGGHIFPLREKLATATKALHQGAFQSRNRVRRAKGPRDRAIALAWEAFCQETLRSLTDRAKP